MRRALVRLAATGALLAAVWWMVDAEALMVRLRSLDLGWFALAALLVVPQLVLSAERWRFTAARLARPLPFSVAIREYWIASALNQVLPGGVAGDALRALRHARFATASQQPGAIGTAVRAVMIERASGQLVLGSVVAVGAFAWPFALMGGSAGASAVALGSLAAAVALAAGGLALAGRLGTGRIARFLKALGRDSLAVFSDLKAWLVQVGLSVLVLAFYLACFAAAAEAAGIGMETVELLLIVPAVLLSMAIPATVAGWGIREAAAAGLFSLAGLSAADGVAASVAYGLAVLTGSLPGLLLIAARR